MSSFDKNDASSGGLGGFVGRKESAAGGESKAMQLTGNSSLSANDLGKSAESTGKAAAKEQDFAAYKVGGENPVKADKNASGGVNNGYYKSDKTDVGDRNTNIYADKSLSNNSDKLGKSDKSDISVGASKSTKSGKSDKTDKPIGANKSNSPNISDKSDKSDKSQKSDKFDKSGKSDKSAGKDKNALKKAGAGKLKPKKPKKIKVLFVCTGNTCRSPMAEQLFKDFLRRRKMLSFFEVGSAGLYADSGARMNDFARQALLGLGVKAAAHESRQLTEVMAEGTNFLVCMTAGHKSQIEGHEFIFSIGELTGGSDVPDPYGGDLARYEAVAKYLQYACEDIFKKAETLMDAAE